MKKKNQQTIYHSDIDPKDLLNFRASEMQVGGVFYVKGDDGSFSRCRIDPEELKNPVRKKEISELTKKYSVEGRLFRRINKPWKGFE